MTLDDVKEAYEALSSKASDIIRQLALAGIALIWLFLAVFLIYPLLRIFYDAFSDETGRLTLQNFVEFVRDAYYLRSLWNSLVLGVATVATTSILGYASGWRSARRRRRRAAPRS